MRENPANLTAWLWALEVAANEKEKRTILNKILALDPTHKGALHYLKNLDQGSVTQTEGPSNSISQDIPPEISIAEPEISRVRGFLRLFTDWVSSLPTTCGFFFLLIIIISVAFFYFRVNTSLFGLIGNDFDDLIISNSYEKISTEDTYWEVQFEGVGESEYIGIVRHASPIRINEFRILTHDILVTTSDFANPDLVDTNVIDHKFFWKSTAGAAPNGSINLIHAVPANKDIYQELLKIQNWDTVKITGREIYTIKAYQSDETFLGTWTDSGCNTLLIEFVSILQDPDQ